jgi:NADPH-dependent 2,4-dienoyl-CoA reductase/sulfur reductase-like enzyme
MIERRVVIVGAGPAGMAAALVLAEAGARPTVLDENPRAGGQIFRQPPPGSAAASAPPKDATAQHGAELVRRFLAVASGEKSLPRIELLNNTSVWGIFPQQRLAIGHREGWQVVAPEQLVLATGAYEYTPPFPGWTLPGVMTPGGAQSLVKTWSVRPGKSAVVAGSGPFLLIVAAQLAAAGVEVRAVVELARQSEFLRQTPRLLSSPGLLLEGAGLFRKLRAAKIPMLWGHVVCAASGEGAVRSVTVAPCNRDGEPERARARTLAADTLAIGYGFVPRIELAQLAGCALEFRDDLGGWIPKTNVEGETSVPNVWVIGDGGGVSGSVVAELEGELAGVAVAGRLGLLDAATVARRRGPLLARLAQLRRFRLALDTVYRVRPGLARLAAKDTLVCRCEELPCEEVDQAVGFGGSDFRTLKVMTRLGMGPCQGRMCWPAMMRRIADRTGKHPEQIGPSRFRPPVRPTAVGDLLQLIPFEDHAPEPAGATERGAR